MNKKMPSAINISGFTNITVAELQAIMKLDGMLLLDVRTEVEVARGKIPKGYFLPLHLLPLRLSGMDKNTTTVFYCQMGGRSGQAAAFAAANGFTDVYNLQGGITAWTQAGLPVES
jgi:rhodanese-related sulfurtransferase